MHCRFNQSVANELLTEGRTKGMLFYECHEVQIVDVFYVVHIFSVSFYGPSYGHCVTFISITVICVCLVKPHTCKSGFSSRPNKSQENEEAVQKDHQKKNEYGKNYMYMFVCIHCHTVTVLATIPDFFSTSKVWTDSP